MTLKAKLRWLSVVQVITAVLMFPIFFCWAPWEAAMTREETLRLFPDSVVPIEWKAVRVSPGGVHEWKLGTVSQNPVGFTLYTLLLASILGVLFWSIWYAARLKGFKRGQYY